MNLNYLNSYLPARRHLKIHKMKLSHTCSVYDTCDNTERKDIINTYAIAKNKFPTNGMAASISRGPIFLKCRGI